MSTDEVPIARAIYNRLLELLARARQLKQTSNINPPVPAADLEDDIASITKVNPDGSANQDIIPPARLHAALETAARDIFYEKLASSSIEDVEFVEVWNLLDIVNICADQGQCDASLALWLIEELLDSQTIDGCRRVFDYLESRRERWITDTNSKNKQMIILRSCNELLHRLSRAEDAVFCGRVFIFLFQSFPLGDKSAVNLRGEFHTENVTTYEDIQPETKNEDKMDVDTETKDEENVKAEEVSKDAQNHKIDESPQTSGTKTTHDKDPSTTKADPEIIEPTDTTKGEDPELELNNLYPIFWSLQSLFSNPTKLFNPSDLAHFKHALELTLKKFKSVPKVEIRRPTRHPAATIDAPRGTKRKHDDPNGESPPSSSIEATTTTPSQNFNTTFTPKYLTTAALLPLELSDPTFQRHILVQSLITLDFLLSLTTKAKSKYLTIKPQKALLYPFTLSETDTTWVTSLRSDISHYLASGADGKFYHRMIDTVLSRDKNWVRWKQESCPPISRPPISADSALEARRSAARTCAPRKLKSHPLGAVTMDFLVDDPAAAETGLEILRNPERFTPPSTKSLLENVQRADLDLEFLGEPTPGEAASQVQGEKVQERAKLRDLRSCATWRALRAARKGRLRVFAGVEEAVDMGLLDEEVEAQRESEKEKEKEKMKQEQEEQGDGVEGEGGDNGEAKKRDRDDDKQDTAEADEQRAAKKVKLEESITEAAAASADGAASTTAPPATTAPDASASSEVDQTLSAPVQLDIDIDVDP